MSLWLRRLAGRLTLVAFVASLVIPLASSTHLQWDDDIDCAQGAVAGGLAETRFDVAQSDSGSHHCEYCHWLRTIASAFPLPAASAAFGQLALEARQPKGNNWQIQAFTSDKPSRAPPARLA